MRRIFSEHVTPELLDDNAEFDSTSLGLSAPPALLRQQLGLSSDAHSSAASQHNASRSRERSQRSESPAICHPPHPPFCTAPSSRMSVCSEQEDEVRPLHPGHERDGA